ncbi:erythromycin esterase family protein [Streptomyces sp. NBC_01275]|uniref:erythromycin esterase family protein n=1 Tax=Streptomyces sp. NBC_01275 TaxID=2903807 RepID=UPI002259CF11|nr:erythromycin esterase family protein [Streptomyces sp. NBC_01275]MCX4767653.1 erythromycin esterase family protein [Streptomyces sp. NBC_01275]
MTQDIRDFVTPSCDLLALGEPTHQEPAFGSVRNELFVQLVDLGFRSIALETDRVAALAVNDFVQGEAGTLDTAMSEGFSHGFGELHANRRLVAWMRAYNEGRPAQERLAFHGFDAPMETTSAPSPRRYLEHARAYLDFDLDPGLDLDLANLLGDDERWSRTEAVMDPARSVGATAGAERLRSIADDMLTSLHARAPKLIAATSHAEWLRARTHLTAGLGLLRYHRQSARPLDDQSARISGLAATRDALMAQNLLDVRGIEALRGPTLVFAHNLHLRRQLSTIRMADLDLDWFGAGAIVASLLGERYGFVAGSLGRSEALGLQEPEPHTYEGCLQRRTAGAWSLTAATAIAPADTRTDTTPRQGYFPLDRETLDTADAVLHIGVGAATGSP